MYPTLLTIHSILRWFVLVALLYTIFNAYRGWFGGKQFTRLDNIFKTTTVSLVHFQLIIGIWLYYISPLINIFLQHFKDSMHDEKIRFFALEHSILMILAITVITIGSAKARRKLTDKDKFKTTAIWFTIGLVIILGAIPWKFLN